MPEGHSVHRIAEDQKDLVGQELCVTSPQGRFSCEAAWSFPDVGGCEGKALVLRVRTGRVPPRLPWECRGSSCAVRLGAGPFLRLESGWSCQLSGWLGSWWRRRRASCSTAGRTHQPVGAPGPGSVAERRRCRGCSSTAGAGSAKHRHRAPRPVGPLRGGQRLPSRGAVACGVHPTALGRLAGRCQAGVPLGVPPGHDVPCREGGAHPHDPRRAGHRPEPSSRSGRAVRLQAGALPPMRDLRADGDDRRPHELCLSAVSASVSSIGATRPKSPGAPGRRGPGRAE